MADMPQTVDELEGRLAKARTEYVKVRDQAKAAQQELTRVISKCVEWERRAVFAETLAEHTLCLLRGDAEPRELRSGDVYHPEPNHPLFLAAIEAVTLGSANIRKGKLLEDVLELGGMVHDEPDEWPELMANIRTELSHDADQPEG